MSEKKDGGPAHEIEEVMRRVLDEQNEKGLRDWFAGMILNGFVSNMWSQYPTVKNETYAKDAYDLADAMLKEREGHE